MSDNQVIPAEAVEVAKAAWLGHTLKPGSMTLEDGMREILEAAAPYMLGIPDALWREFQAATATAGTNPSETIRQLVRDWVDNNNKQGEK